jgi:V-type H+-transporting ATPase subunit D
VANKKQRDTAAADAEMKQKRLAQEQAHSVSTNVGQGPAPSGNDPADLLTAEDDHDVIF